MTSCCGCDILYSINKIRKEDKIVIKYEITFEKRKDADEFLKVLEPIRMYSIEQVESWDSAEDNN